jgi:hypothetical protein
MKKLFILIALCLASYGVFSQTYYFKNLIIKEAVHKQDLTRDSAYIVVKGFEVISQNGGSSVILNVRTDIYKNKATWLAQPSWKLALNEFGDEFSFVVAQNFASGNINDKVVDALKAYIISTHPTWNPANIKIDTP